MVNMMILTALQTGYWKTTGKIDAPSPDVGISGFHNPHQRTFKGVTVSQSTRCQRVSDG